MILTTQNITSFSAIVYYCRCDLPLGDASAVCTRVEHFFEHLAPGNYPTLSGFPAGTLRGRRFAGDCAAVAHQYLTLFERLRLA